MHHTLPEWQMAQMALTNLHHAYRTDRCYRAFLSVTHRLVNIVIDMQYLYAAARIEENRHRWNVQCRIPYGISGFIHETDERRPTACIFQSDACAFS